MSHFYFSFLLFEFSSLWSFHLLHSPPQLLSGKLPSWILYVLSQVFPHSFLRPHPCRASFSHHFPVLTLDSLPCPSSFAVRNPVETFQLINQLDARAGEWGCLMVGFGDRGARSEIPLLCCYRLGSRKDLQILFSILSPESLFCGAAGKEQRETSSSGSAGTVAVAWVGLNTLWLCMRGLRLWRWFLFSSAYKWNFWCGTGWECDSHHCLQRIKRKKEETITIFLYVWQKLRCEFII